MGGVKSEAPRGVGVPLPTGGRVWAWGVPHPQKNFAFFCIKI